MDEVKTSSRMLVVARVAAVLVALIGATSLLGWHAHWPWLLKVPAGATAMRYNTALCFVLAGVSLVLAGTRIRAVSIVLSATGLLTALSTLLEHLFVLDFGIDQMLMKSWLDALVQNPGRMAVNTSLALTLAFVALLVAAIWHRSHSVSVVISVLGSLVFGLGTIALVGYASGLPFTYTWRGFNGVGIAPLSAAALTTLGVGLFAAAWNRAASAKDELPRWLPLTAAIVVFTAGLVMWQALEGRDLQGMAIAVETASHATASSVRAEVSDRVRAIERVARRMERGERPGDLMWIADEKQFANDFPGILDLQYAEADGGSGIHVDVSSAFSPEDRVQLATLASEVTRTADDEPQMGRTAVVAGIPTVIVAVRAHIDPTGVKRAWVLGVFDAAQSMRVGLADRVRLGYETHVADADGTTIWSSFAGRPHDPVVRTATSLFGRKWAVDVSPGAAVLQQWNSSMPLVALASSVVLGVLLAGILALLQSSRRLHRQAEAAREALEKEIVERRHAEETVRRSEALLRLVLETLPVGVWIADPQGNIVTVNETGKRVWGGAKYVDIEHYDEYKGWHVDTGKRVAGDEWALARAVRGETVLDLVADIETFDGQMKTVSCAGVPIRHPDGSSGGALVVVEDITERVKAQRALAERTADLERSNSELEQFAYVASHDLQEPLRMVASYVQLLARRYQGKLDADADEFIRFAVDGARRMQSLLNDLLAYSRVGTRGKAFARVDMNEALRAAEDNLQLAIAETGATITHDTLPAINADDTQLVQLLQNLLANAMKFRSQAPPKIHVGMTRRAGQATFSVADNGIGIDPAYRDRIFQIFQRLNGQKFPGTGVGLAIAKKIVNRHGGQIWVESGEGQGSIFFFTLPGVAPRHPKDAGPTAAIA